MATPLDCTGLPCPQPVLRCKRRLEDDSPAHLEIVVDNDAAAQNVTRFLQSQGFGVTQTLEAGIYTLSAARDAETYSPVDADGCELMNADALAAAGVRCVVFLTAETIGRGDDVLGGKLMQNFLATLPELGKALWRVVCVNGAVRLAVEEHPAFAHLKALEDAGAEVLVCGTCLEHFGLAERRAVGQTTNMLDVVTSLQLAGKLITP